MSTLQIRIFDGTRQLFSAPAQFLVTITDGNKTQRVRNFYPDNDITFDLPFFDNFGDNYTVLVWADGYQQAGFTPVTLSDQAAKVLDIMLIPKDPGFSFAAARWDAVSASYPFLGGDVDSATAATRYRLFHPGATSSWKQIQFGEANVQLTFHESTMASVGGIDCVMVEPDIDYYQDLGAHALLEVIPNALTHSLTEPAQVYVLRWIAGQTAGVPEFNPMYTITS
jgi:hypothetical protein